jgi:hypothetical protein
MDEYEHILLHVYGMVQRSRYPENFSTTGDKAVPI